MTLNYKRIASLNAFYWYLTMQENLPTSFSTLVLHRMNDSLNTTIKKTVFFSTV